MKFTDITLLGGKIKSRRTEYTERLATVAVRHCADLLRNLRRGEIELPHGVPGLVPFLVSLGTPAWLKYPSGQQIQHVGRIFCVRHPQADRPFQINLVLRRDGARSIEAEDADRDDLAAGSVVAISAALMGKDDRFEMMESTVNELLSLRPAVAACIEPTAIQGLPDDSETVMVAADFATCFAAAMLIEP